MAPEAAALKLVKTAEAWVVVGRRIESARKFDQALSAAGAAVGEYEDAWLEIAAISELHDNGAGSFSHDANPRRQVPRARRRADRDLGSLQSPRIRRSEPRRK